MKELTDLIFRQGFIPHGYCFAWSPDLLWTYVVADTLIGLSYYSIPVALVYFVSRRKGTRYSWMFVMFGAFMREQASLLSTALRLPFARREARRLRQEALDDRQRKARRLASAGLRRAHHVAAGEHHGNRLRLDRRRDRVAGFGHRLQDVGGQTELVERGRGCGECIEGPGCGFGGSGGRVREDGIGHGNYLAFAKNAPEAARAAVNMREFVRVRGKWALGSDGPGLARVESAGCAGSAPSAPFAPPRCFQTAVRCMFAHRAFGIGPLGLQRRRLLQACFVPNHAGGKAQRRKPHIVALRP